MKEEVRRRLRAARDALAPEDRRRGSKAVVERLRNLPVTRRARTIGGYHPLASEVDVLEFLAEAVRLGRTVALPRVVRAGLDLHAWTPATNLERSAWGIMEPLQEAPRVDPGDLEVVLVPGLAFDRLGHRLGFGKGFYDRLLEAVPQAARVGVSYDVQLVDVLPREGHDVPLGWLVTPTQTLRFGDGSKPLTGSDNP